MKMHDPHLTLVETITGTRTYYFRSTDRLGGWAFCTVDDKTGQLMIMSDWGNWSHMWNPKHLGAPSLTHFIADREGYDYLACKLLGRDGAWVLDADATIKKWRKRLCAQRLAEGREGADAPPYYLPRERRLDAYRARSGTASDLSSTTSKTRRSSSSTHSRSRTSRVGSRTSPGRRRRTNTATRIDCSTTSFSQSSPLRAARP